MSYLTNSSYHVINEMGWAWHIGPKKKDAFKVMENMTKEYPNHEFHVEFFKDGKWTVIEH